MKKLVVLIILLLVLMFTLNCFAVTCYWLGTDDGNEGDWKTHLNWSPYEPNAGDTVVFDGRTTQDVNDGIAQAETGGTVFALVLIRESFTGDIGDVNERFHCAATKVICEGSGNCWLEVSAANNTTDVNISKVILNNTSAHLYVTSQINDTNYCAEVNTLIAVSGTLEIGDANKDTAVKDLYITSGFGEVASYSKPSEISVVINEDCEKYKATTYKMNIYMQNGVCSSDSAVNILEQYGGTFTYGTDLAASPQTGLNIATLKLYYGTFNWHPDDSGNDAYIGNVYLFGGTFDASSSTNRDRSKALGNGTGYDIYVFEKAAMLLNNNMGNITIATNSLLYNFGGSITVDSGVNLGITY